MHRNFSQADVSNPRTFEVIGKVLKEIAPLFRDEHFGFGGDETCDWLSAPHIAAWAEAHSGQPGYEKNMSSHGALFRYFGRRVQALLPEGKIPAWWNDAVVQNVSSPSGTLYWNWGAGCAKGFEGGSTCPPGDELTGMLRDGRKVVQSHGWCKRSSPSQLSSKRHSRCCADVGPSETTDIAGDPLKSTFSGQFCGGDADSNGGGSCECSNGRLGL